MMQDSRQDLKQDISAWMDGEGDTETLARLEFDPQARAIWLRYHQIGDLLRSAELQPLPHEQAFTDRLLQRLQQEPQAAAAAPRWSQRWQQGLAALAGVAAVALLTLRLPSGLPQQAEWSQPLPLGGVMRAEWRASGDHDPARLQQLADADAAVTDWSPYLLAHQQLAGALSDPPGPQLPGQIDALR